jgi:hypothetical protein
MGSRVNPILRDLILFDVGLMSIYLLVELYLAKPNLYILTLAIRRIGVRLE